MDTFFGIVIFFGLFLGLPLMIYWKAEQARRARRQVAEQARTRSHRPLPETQQSPWQTYAPDDPPPPPPPAGW